jgi:hypothetical protein
LLIGVLELVDGIEGGVVGEHDGLLLAPVEACAPGDSDAGWAGQGLHVYVVPELGEEIEDREGWGRAAGREFAA